MTDLELGYVAGIYDGEGSVIIQTQNNSSQHVVIRIKSTDLDILEKMQRFTQSGNIIGPYFKENRKPCWYWNIYRMKEAQNFLVSVHPLVSKRRQKDIESALELLSSKLDRMIPCERCEKEFHPVSHRAKYCSKECGKNTKGGRNG